MTNNLKPIGCHGFSCVCCGKKLLPHEEVFVCADCGAVICQTCANEGEAEAHVCEEDME